VTCLFVNLKKLSLDNAEKKTPATKNEDARKLMKKISQSFAESEARIKSPAKSGVNLLAVHKALYVMQSILFHYEGVVRQFLVGKTGICIFLNRSR
jgi:hypothetical protein